MKPRDMSTLSLVTQLGLTVVIALILSLLLGLWLDNRLDTKPLFTLVFSLFGIMIGTIGVYRLVTRAIAESVAQAPRTRSSGTASMPADEGGDASGRDPWADDEADDGEDDWDRDPWKDDDPAAQVDRWARQEEAEQQFGPRPPKAKQTPPKEEGM